ncbi:MAG: AI-2E family transporter [Coriobacteriia bacterium]|nr:AI-2E family transporter [Coriobacteriia bacterium]
MSADKSRSHNRWTRALTITWSLVGIGLLVAAGGWLLGKVSSALVPFLLAIVIVYLFRTPVAILERRGMKRGLAVGLCYLVGFVVLGLVLGFLVPALVEQVREFILAFPGYYRQASALLLDLQGRYEALVIPPWAEDAMSNLQDTVTRQSAEWSSILAREIFSAGGSAISLLGTSVLALVVGFWVLKDLPVINSEMLLLAGPERREEVTVVTGKVSKVLGGYLRGQLILSSATAILVTTGLALFGVPYSLVIGLLAGVFNVIPWIGPALTAIIAGIAAAFVSPWHILAGVGVCLASQQVTEIFVQPRVMSEQVDLHPLLVIFSLLVGGTLFGFGGLVLAIPVAAVAKGLFVYYFEKSTDSKLTSEDGALFRSHAEEEDDESCPETKDTSRADVAQDADEPKLLEES